MPVIVTKKSCEPCEATIRINCSTIADTATEGVDFEPIRDQMLIFGPSVNSLNCEIPIINDDLVEGLEKFVVVVTTDDKSIVEFEQNSQSCTINDNDKVTVQFSSNSYSVTEKDSNIILGFEMIGKVITNDLIITLRDTPGTAKRSTSEARGDYILGSELNPKKVTLPKGKNYTTYTVSVSDDATAESNETYAIRMETDAENGAFITFGTPSTTTITIIDDDKATITFEKSADKVNEQDGTLDIKLKKTTETELAITTKVTCIDGTAKKGVDYVDNTWTQNWGNAKDEEMTIKLSVTNNVKVDGGRTLKLKLSTETPDKVNFGTEEMEITIINEDKVTIAFKSASVTVNEDVGTASTIELERTGTTPLVNVSVKVTTSDGTAKGGQDFVAMSDQVITFTPSDTVKTVPVVIINDNIQEADQKFGLVLTSDDSSVTVGSTSQCAVTIKSDDVSIFSLLASTYAIAEGDGPVKVVINREQKSEGVDNVVVKLTTSDGTALTGAGQDFGGGTFNVRFDSNDISKEIPIALFDDDIVELNETFTVTITPINAATAKIGNISDATITILNDDKEIFEFSASTFSAKEDTKQAVVTITKAGKATLASHTMTVLFSTSDVTANSSSALDYTSITDLQVTFAPSDTSKSVTITLSEDNIVENDETFKVQLKAFSWLSKIGTTNEATVTIENDDKGNITFNESTYTVIEGENVTFNFGCSGNNDIDLNFKITASPVIVSHTNSRKADYTLADNTPLTCGPRALGINYTMPTTQDNNAEWPESFHVDTTTTDTGIINFAISQTTVTIIDNEDKVNLWIKDAAYNLTEDEGSITMTVMKTDNAEVDIIVRLTSADIIANSANQSIPSAQDFKPVFQNITISPSETEKTFTIPITTDDYLEYNDTFRIFIETLTPNKTDSILRNETFFTIYNDDHATLEFVERSVTLKENQGVVVLTVRLLGKTLIPVFFNLSTINITAFGNRDFPALVGKTYSFGPSISGNTSMEIEIDVTKEAFVEHPERFDIVMTTNQPFVTVVENKSMSEIHVQNDDAVLIGFMTPLQTVVEANGFVNVCVVVERGLPEIPLYYNVSTTYIDTTVGRDFIPLTNFTVLIPYRSSISCFTVTIEEDHVTELDESFGISLSSDYMNVTVDENRKSTVIKILNDDKVTMEIDGPTSRSLAEGEKTVVSVVAKGHYEIPLSILIAPNKTSTTDDGDFRFTSLYWPIDNQSLPEVADYPAWRFPVPQSLAHNMTMVFNRGAKHVAIEVEIPVDRQSESMETLVLSLLSLDPSRVVFGNNQTVELSIQNTAYPETKAQAGAVVAVVSVSIAILVIILVAVILAACFIVKRVK
ncbi:adhesion G-protein coupled receptor V1-like [Nematostella vectensis]|uniref:adhesion G-protein coupled receptor V1-like n=1 Tax=Nematostella vectensis TaxID=45351 RepID=UPI0020776472|nr:adhesion G-protein coupled receptor V1-like [Nematostella vectensis]XP_048587277.1 adhesion G-protein coupled receptor V1-like [Nematostella vectensis]XP_048587278.1 adhesion G-protein coupled receptor V1-like [Nematostella vectensis]